MNGRDSEAGEAAVRDLSGQGGEIAFVAGDVGRAADCERLAAETASLRRQVQEQSPSPGPLRSDTTT